MALQLCCMLCYGTLHTSCLQVMNEVVVDRGQSPFLTNIEIFCNQRLMTTVQGDGEGETLSYECTCKCFLTFFDTYVYRSL